jgi:uncharacterized protein YuzB (UPF0349 family)
MARLIEYCVSNVTATERRRLEDADVDANARMCLEQCGRCYSGPFLVVNGERRQGQSHRDLLATLAPDADRSPDADRDSGGDSA